MFSRPLRVAFIGNALPRRCGIATFTTDLELAVNATADIAGTAIIAMRDPGGDYAYPPSVRLSIDQDDPDQYLAAAEFINAEGFDLVCLQHEFGIFGGDAGCRIVDLIEALNVPLVTTLHTILDKPSDAQRQVMNAILASSAGVVVMARKGRDILAGAYGAELEKITVIPHGIPDAPFVTSDGAKERLGYTGRKIVLTFGLLSPNKGIETMIEAMPAIIERSSDALYVVMGATHPHLVRDAGEAYRESLLERVRSLGLKDHIVFLDRFVDRPELLEHITMCDVYATPYVAESQMTSGTLAYSHGLGRPVVSTPYWHAAELLDDGSGVLVPFADTVAFGRAVGALLEDEPTRLAMGRKAYAASRAMTWEHTAERYVECFRLACRRKPRRLIRGIDVPACRLSPSVALPTTSTRHFTDMCDDTGMYQHAVHNIPDRSHGYCIDDNARALLLCCTSASGLDPLLEDRLAQRFGAFIQHAWNPDNRRFRNFMGFNRQWLEPAGSEDSHGRTLWALGACTQQSGNPARARWATNLFAEALKSVSSFTSPRAWAFILLGLDAYCRAHPEDIAAKTDRGLLARKLEGLLLSAESPGWIWFEDRLTYDNARLCEAAIRTGGATGERRLVDAGLRSLRWLLAMQTAPEGYFRPIGSHGFMMSRSPPLAFDQQPLEACATIAACVAANEVDPSPQWEAEAERAFAWFLGKNDLAIPLVDVATGSCRDGLHPDRANENRGAESVLSYLLGLADMRRFDLADGLSIFTSVSSRSVAPANDVNV